MNAFDMPQWGAIAVPDASLLEAFARGSVVYLALVILFRVVLQRQGGTLGLPDAMLIVLVSECVSNSLVAEAKSVSNGLTAVAAMLFWNIALDKTAARWPWLQRRLEPPAQLLVRDGRPVRRALDAEGITDDELAAQLRLHGVDEIGKVKTAYLESEGSVSVVKGDEAPDVATLTRFLAAADAARRVLDGLPVRSAAATGEREENAQRQ